MKSIFMSVIAVALLALLSPAQMQAQDRFGVGAQLVVHRLPELGETRTGYGFRLITSPWVPFIAFDSELNFFPTSSSGNIGETQLFVGLKGTVRVRRWGVFLKARPGFAHFGGGATPQRLTEQIGRASCRERV